MPANRIHSAGPSITNKEIEFVNDAIRNGWYSHYRNYLEKFENSFAKYSGAKYAIATNCCTAAMHLALATINLKAGDEVIIPDLSWIATAAVIVYQNAKPVFVDIEKDSWTIDPSCIRKAITKKTKAIMPVHLYGHPAEMDDINKIAKEHNLYVVADAAPAVGSLYKDKKIATVADISCFSFQGAKMMVTGEGGMFVTGNESLYERASRLVEDGRLPGTFWINEIGYHYRMANLLAALGLAQLERVDELISMKRRHFDMYYERLSNIAGIKMFKEKKYCRSNCSYPSILLTGKLSNKRDDLIKRLRERHIDTRPVFPKMSNFPMFKKVDNPISEDIANNGLNLSTPAYLTEENADIVVNNIREILKI